ncbi:MAG TPA: hypothetical protein VF575_03945 [Candidatus Saccharimonadales bacterium]|jgi:hypothetical protein
MNKLKRNVTFAAAGACLGGVTVFGFTANERHNDMVLADTMGLDELADTKRIDRNAELGKAGLGIFVLGVGIGENILARRPEED